ncbi:hypothetical protein D0Z08_09860 [Nocardioides immobilis]|uniref:Prenyltransferase n=1 Tax=Nocardioides immobilis TaxID=2049295 RepID=A0A417Y453_9ACTN|nr:hypothetical protein [Nocardioides immobilis]RHW27442.1 hypothetical protein D0Z08_09860 [Nocardioides immobilis]
MPDQRDAQRIATLLDFPDAHPYKKWWGSHWRLVALADLGAQPPPSALDKGVGQVLGWLDEHRDVRRLRNGLPLRHASQEGNAVYACVRLGVDDDRVEGLVQTLLESQWPDGGWNCSRNASGRRSSFHESVTPAIGLAVFGAERDDEVARAAARRTADLLLDHDLFRNRATGEPIHPSFVVLHYPPYWHYDLLQGLVLCAHLGVLDDPRAKDALDLVESRRDAKGRYPSRSWESSTNRDVIAWGRSPDNDVLARRADAVLRAAGRLPSGL